MWPSIYKRVYAEPEHLTFTFSKECIQIRKEKNGSLGFAGLFESTTRQLREMISLGTTAAGIQLWVGPAACFYSHLAQPRGDSVLS